MFHEVWSEHHVNTEEDTASEQSSSSKEVKEVITIDLEYLLNCKITQTQISIPEKLNELNIQNDVEVPAFKLAGYNVWGATAMMLSEIRDLINDVI